MKSIITTALEVVGAALIVTGVALIWFPLGIIIAGAALIGISLLVVGR